MNHCMRPKEAFVLTVLCLLGLGVVIHNYVICLCLFAAMLVVMGLAFLLALFFKWLD